MVGKLPGWIPFSAFEGTKRLAVNLVQLAAKYPDFVVLFSTSGLPAYLLKETFFHAEFSSSSLFTIRLTNGNSCLAHHLSLPVQHYCLGLTLNKRKEPEQSFAVPALSLF